MDLSGGTESAARRGWTGAIRTDLPKASPPAGFEDFQLLFGEGPVAALGERTQPHGADAHTLQGDQTQAASSARASYYAVTALMDGEVEDNFLPSAARARELRGEHSAVFHFGARDESSEASLKAIFGRHEGYLVL